MKIQCATCGVDFSWTPPARGGRPAKHCPAHRRGGQPVRDAEGAKRRSNAKRRAKGPATRAAAQAVDPTEAQLLAAGMSVDPDTTWAARSMGLAAVGDRLDDLVAYAREHYADIISGEPAGLRRRLMADLHALRAQLVGSRALLAPRDLAHNMRALAQVADLVAPADKTPQIAELKLYVVGADGVPFDPNSVEQPKREGSA